MQTRVERAYEIDGTGTVFTIDTTLVLDDGGNTVARILEQRTPYIPGSDTKTLADPVLKAIATAAWTPTVVAAYKPETAF